MFFKKNKEKVMEYENIKVEEVLNNVDQRMISNWIAEYGTLNSPVKSSTAPLPFILRHWAINKAPFYHAFGNQLILSRKFDYECPLGELRDQCYRMSNSMVDHFMTNMSRIFIGATYQKHPTDKYFRSEEDPNGNPISNALRAAHIPNYYFSTPCMWDMLIDNKWTFDDVKVPMDNGKFFTFKRGMRITRIFQKVAELMELEGFEEVRELHAKVSTAKIVHGEICLSIHPLDFITMSDNEDGWDSCMNWVNHGDYRAGTVEMLNSPCIVMAYMPSKANHLHIQGDEWNSKVWRELYIVDKDMISNIRSYPFIDANISKYVVRWIKELMEEDGFSNYDSTMRPCGGCEDWPQENHINLRIDCNNMYNDYFRETQWCYFTKDFVTKYSGDDFYLNYSGPMICMNCGESLSKCLDETRMVMCDDCSDSEEEHWDCEYCGNEIYDESELYIVDGEYLCESCFNDPDCVVEAYDDYESHLAHNCTPIYLGDPSHGTMIYVYDINNFLRNNKDNITKDNLMYVYENPSQPWSSTCYMIPIHSVTDYMLNSAGVWDNESYRKTCEEEDSDKEYKLATNCSA